MRRVSWWFLVMALAATAPACLIGTWPTPEDTDPTSKGATPGQPLSPEACDGFDNDADGSVDEGCPCTEVARGCAGHDDAHCGLGVQWCTAGIWQECTDLGPPFTPVRNGVVALSSVSPAALVRGQGQALTVVVTPVTRCAGTVATELELRLVAALPQMSIRARPHDDGLEGDLVAGDGAYTATLVDPFGPGVGAQSLALTATAVIDGSLVAAHAAVPLEEP
ncbi:MAG: hypothetical protein HY903_05185 [Deltaproteobacteria bacterium]|nr:hypothetical protein [Deltaproteobacteria bacterium]